MKHQSQDKEKSDELIPEPLIKQEIVDAAESGTLVVFIGAGISRLAGCPSWDEFANKVLDELINDNFNYYEASLIKAIPDPRKRLSIAKIIENKNQITANYKEILKGDISEDTIYKYINAFQCTFVTTNYDVLIQPEIIQPEIIQPEIIQPEIIQPKKEKDWRFYEREDLHNNKLDGQGNVIHLHGCVKNPKSMVITTKDYLEHYSDKQVQDFLEYLFKSKTILFLGYSLEEVEILEYILKYSVKNNNKKEEKKEKRLFMLQGFLAKEQPLYKRLKDYYTESFSVELIGFEKNKINDKHQTIILEKWAKKLSFKPLALSDEAKFMLEELDG